MTVGGEFYRGVASCGGMRSIVFNSGVDVATQFMESHFCSCKCLGAVGSGAKLFRESFLHGTASLSFSFTMTIFSALGVLFTLGFRPSTRLTFVYYVGQMAGNITAIFIATVGMFNPKKGLEWAFKVEYYSICRSLGRKANLIDLFQKIVAPFCHFTALALQGKADENKDLLTLCKGVTKLSAKGLPQDPQKARERVSKLVNSFVKAGFLPEETNSLTNQIFEQSKPEQQKFPNRERSNSV